MLLGVCSRWYAVGLMIQHAGLFSDCKTIKQEKKKKKCPWLLSPCSGGDHDSLFSYSTWLPIVTSSKSEKKGRVKLITLSAPIKQQSLFSLGRRRLPSQIIGGMYEKDVK